MTISHDNTYSQKTNNYVVTPTLQLIYRSDLITIILQNLKFVNFFLQKYHIFATKYHKIVFSGENMIKKREERCSSDRFSFCLKKEILKDAIEETNTAHLLIAP